MVRMSNYSNWVGKNNNADQDGLDDFGGLKASAEIGSR
jgi:hypothetical protein